MSINKIKNKIKNIVESVQILNDLNYLRVKVIHKFISDKVFTERDFTKYHNTKLHLDAPKTFNEKIKWRILKDRNDLYTKLSDKFLVREYVKAKIGGSYLIKLLGVYDDVSKINYDELPNKFVLKCNHDSGSVIICRDKTSFDFNKARYKLANHLKKNFYILSKEWQYKNIKPLIVCEEFLDDNGRAPADYKFHVFNSKTDCVMYIQYDSDRFKEHKRIIFDSEWVPQKFNTKFKTSGPVVDKPYNFNLMKKLAAKLSEEFKYVRVDFYEVNRKVYFGELTFTSDGGRSVFYPVEWDLNWGELWEIND